MSVPDGAFDPSLWVIPPPDNFSFEIPTPAHSQNSTNGSTPTMAPNDAQKHAHVSQESNWSEHDSILLVKVHVTAKDAKKRTSIIHNLVLIVANESKQITEKRIYDIWLSLGPDNIKRTDRSVAERWTEMTSKFKYILGQFN
jgi:hypothetical protein